ncbi:class I tRNA ligase family protein, partial [Patescibacteria group bacterium]|nr:class I tRNA ligase family protein [Patescibacteria group bacterium]
MTRGVFKKIEKKWQKFWEKHPEFYQIQEIPNHKSQNTNKSQITNHKIKSKKYVLVEFPYPSGYGLHVGHAFTFTGGDVYARFKRMQGYNVLFPMGWDAFGLPTENYAIKVKKKPQDVTRENTDMFREQMKELAFSFDWSREVNTTDPGYYKWTQWIFIKLFEKGLAYKKEMPINWCPSCKIGLANEEVVDGKCERCGCAEVSRRNINQWVVKITDYADRLIEGLKKTDFIEKVKASQINWIGKKDWIDISYPVNGIGEEIVVSTTRPDTNFGATFVVVAPEHPFVSVILSGAKDPDGIVKKCGDSSSASWRDQNDGEILSQSDEKIEEIKEYVKKAKKRSELDRISEGKAKTGVFTGFYAVNQLNGKKMPIWITDFVLMTVGTGAVVGVPGHDIRDFEFAKQFGLPIVRVVVGENGDKSEIKRKDQVQEKDGKMINSGFLDGMDIHEATKKIMDYLEKKDWGKKITRYHLRDWIFSRQHYWGEPIPMISCKKCGWVPVSEDQLPIELPRVEAYEPTDTGESPLAKITDWVKTTCCKCGGLASRET